MRAGAAAVKSRGPEAHARGLPPPDAASHAAGRPSSGRLHRSAHAVVRADVAPLRVARGPAGERGLAAARGEPRRDPGACGHARGRAEEPHRAARGGARGGASSRRSPASARWRRRSCCSRSRSSCAARCSAASGGAAAASRFEPREAVGAAPALPFDFMAVLFEGTAASWRSHEVLTTLGERATRYPTLAADARTHWLPPGGPARDCSRASTAASPPSHCSSEHSEPECAAAFWLLDGSAPSRTPSSR